MAFEKITHWRILSLANNSGQQAATMAGLCAAMGESIITMDDDGQHRVDDISKLCGCLGEGFDITYGVYRIFAHNAWRNWSSRIVKDLGSRLYGEPKLAFISSFRLLRGDGWLIDALKNSRVESFK